VHIEVPGDPNATVYYTVDGTEVYGNCDIIDFDPFSRVVLSHTPPHTVV